MAIQDADDVKPGDLINIRPVSAAIKEFLAPHNYRNSWTSPTRWPN